MAVFFIEIWAIFSWAFPLTSRSSFSSRVIFSWHFLNSFSICAAVFCRLTSNLCSSSSTLRDSSSRAAPSLRSGPSWMDSSVGAFLCWNNCSFGKRWEREKMKFWAVLRDGSLRAVASFRSGLSWMDLSVGAFLLWNIWREKKMKIWAAVKSRRESAPYHHFGKCIPNVVTIVFQTIELHDR